MDYKTIRDRIEDISLSITLILSCKFCLSSAAFWMYSSSCLTDLIPCSLMKITDSAMVFRVEDDMIMDMPFIYMPFIYMR